MSDQDPVRFAVNDSEGPLEARTSRTVARSKTDLAMGPAESKWLDMGTIPSWGTRPIVGLMVYKAALPAGKTNDPSVSVPIENGAYPAETPTAEPEDDPEGLWGAVKLSSISEGWVTDRVPIHRVIRVKAADDIGRLHLAAHRGPTA